MQKEQLKSLKYSGNLSYVFVCILGFHICLQTQIFFVYMLSVYAELSNPHSLLEII